MTEDMHISSLVVHVRPDSMDTIQEYIEGQGGEIPAIDPVGKMVIVLETPTDSAVTDFANHIALMDGVLSANLVFHHFDSSEQITTGSHKTQTLGELS